MDIELKAGILYLSGRMDEYAKFDDLLTHTAPLKLNLGKVISINSIGVRKFLAFTLAWSPRKFEFFECTPEFISNANVIPQMLGSPCDETQIKSFYVPFRCESCKKMGNVLVLPDQITFDAINEPVVPDQRCPRCGELMEMDAERAEYFMFLRGDG